jgi:hypothetical protein
MEMKKIDNDTDKSLEKKNLRYQQQEELRIREEQSFKKIFTHKFLGPLVIGFIVAVVGMMFENDSLIYMGTGIHIFGWFLWMREK